MTGPPSVPWQRYWRDRDGRTDAAEGAVFLALGLADQAGLLSTEEAATHRCAVFLAPPGAGKSFELRALVDGWNGDARRISLGGPGNDSLLLSKIDAALRDLRTPGALLALDSLDETPLGVSALTELVDDVAARLPEAVHLVLACRSAGWLPAVEDVLRRRFDRDVNLFVLQPLTDGDVLLYAQAAGVDGDAFLRALRDSRVAELARSPHTLSLLVAEYRAAGAAGTALPGGQRELFERSCRRLVTESNDRLDLRKPSDADLLLGSAQRLATLSLFSGRQLFTLSDVTGPDHLTRADCGVDGYAQVLNTALFDTVGDDRLAFTHQTVTEFLAAKHLIDTGLPLSRLHQLLHGRGGRLAPQVQAVAAWLVAMEPDRFGALLANDPEAFIRSGVELTDPDYRGILVDRLLELAQGHELLRIHELNLTNLHYGGLDRRLRSVLTDPESTQDACYLAIRIARRTGLIDMHDVLTATALDSRRMVPTRSAAGSADLALVPPDQNSPLLALAEPAFAPGDPDDELLGVGLQAHLRAAVPVSEVLGMLRAPNNPDLFGSYRSVLLIDLPRRFDDDALSIDELRESLRWATAVEPPAGDRTRDRAGLWAATAELNDAILACGLRHMVDEGVRVAVADLLVQRLRTSRPLPRSRRTRLPIVSEEVRGNFLATLREKGLEDRNLLRLVRAGVLAREDVPRPPAPAIPLADDEDNEDEEEVPEAPTEDRLQQHMAGALRLGVEEAFPAFCFWASFAPGSVYATHPNMLRVVRLPGWALCDQTRRVEALGAARHYLASAIDPARDGQAFSAAQALALLADQGSRPVLPESRWRSLAWALMRGLHASCDDAALVPSLQWVYALARRDLLDAAVEEMRENAEFAQFPLRRLRPVLTTQDTPWLRWLITEPTTDGATVAVACDILATLETTVAIRLLRDISPGRRRSLGTAVLRHGGPEGWPAIHTLLSIDRALAADIIGDIAEHGEELVRPLDEDQTTELWALTDELFPRSGDPVVHGVHSVSRRENVALMRDRMLPVLAERGTPSAVAALQRLAAARPDEPMYKRIVALAKAAQARSDWHPLAPSEITEVLTRSDVAELAVEDELVSEQQPLQVDGWDAVSVLAGLGASALIAVVVWARDGFEVVSWIFGIVFGALTIFGLTKRIRFTAYAPTRFRRLAAVFAVSTALSTGIVVLAQRDDGSKTPPSGLPLATGPWTAPTADASTAVDSTSPAEVPSADGIPSTKVTTRSAAEVTLSAEQVEPGSSVTVSGSGFLSGEIVRVELFPGGGLTNFDGPYQLGDFPADVSGVLRPTTVTVHEELCCAGATVQMHVTGRTSHRSGRALLILK